MLNDEVFVFDNVIHTYDNSDENFDRSDAYLDQGVQLRRVAKRRPLGQDEAYGIQDPFNLNLFCR